MALRSNDLPQQVGARDLILRVHHPLMRPGLLSGVVHPGAGLLAAKPQGYMSGHRSSQFFFGVPVTSRRKFVIRWA